MQTVKKKKRKKNRYKSLYHRIKVTTIFTQYPFTTHYINQKPVSSSLKQIPAKTSFQECGTCSQQSVRFVYK